MTLGLLEKCIVIVGCILRSVSHIESLTSRQALQLHKGDPAPVILEIINTIEGGPPVDVSVVRTM